MRWRSRDREAERKYRETQNALATFYFVPEFSREDAWNAVRMWWSNNCPLSSNVYFTGLNPEDLVPLGLSPEIYNLKLRGYDVRVSAMGPFDEGGTASVSIGDDPRLVERVCPDLPKIHP